VKSFKLSICSHPTRVGLVDDDEPQLEKFVLHLTGHWKLACFSYSDPHKALHFLMTDYRADPFINRCLRNKEDNEVEHLVVDFDIRAIHQEIYNPDRFNEMTVLVVDYAMPGINGVDICRLLRKNNPFLKIIMLTGEAGKDLAIQTFNEGLIDKFIMKSTPNLLTVLAQSINELQKAYFLKLSEIVLSKIAGSSDYKLTCLEDAVFVEFFTKLCDEQHIVEYYLMDNQGSFLLMDAQGKVSWLAVANEELMLTYANLAEEDAAPESVIKSLKTKQMMPYFYSEEDFNVRPAQWQQYLHAAHKLQGKETYYYAHITNPDAYKIERAKIKSYRQFLNAHS